VKKLLEIQTPGGQHHFHWLYVPAVQKVRAADDRAHGPTTCPGLASACDNCTDSAAAEFVFSGTNGTYFAAMMPGHADGAG
jgi:hypothetical protein